MVLLVSVRGYIRYGLYPVSNAFTVRNPRGRTPSVSATHSPRLPSDRDALELRKLVGATHSLGSPERTHIQLQTLYRDEVRCRFTGMIDFRHLEDVDDPTPPYLFTRAVHIVSQSLTENIRGITTAVQNKARSHYLLCLRTPLS